MSETLHPIKDAAYKLGISVWTLRKKAYEGNVAETGFFQLVIVDYFPNTEKEKADLLMLQRYNLQAPIINVSAWARLAHADNRRLIHDLLRLSTSVFGRPVPKRLPVKRAHEAGSVQSNEDRLFKERPATGT